MKHHAPYCDYCGEVITNYHKIESGEDISVALQTKEMKEMLDQKPTIFGKVIMYIALFGICFMFFPMGVYGRLCFCNKKHKDLYAKSAGLRKGIIKK